MAEAGVKALIVIAGSAKRSGRLVRRLPARFAALATTGALIVGSATAQTLVAPRGADAAPEALRPLVGAWDIERIGAPRKCTITLGAETDARFAHGRKVRMPATCQRALPILGGVFVWTVTDEGAPRLLDSAGELVLGFAKGEDGLRAMDSKGQSYRLDPKGHPRAAPRPVQSPAELAATAAQRPTQVDPARAPAPGSLPGLYSVMRQPNREACRLSFSATAEAAFEGRCADTGLTIFNPVGWRYEAGRLRLIARKGHTVELIFADGLWRKDPAVGAPLLLRKLSP